MQPCHYMHKTAVSVLFCRREDKRKCSSDMLNAEAEECRGCSEVCSHGGCTGKVNEQLILIQGQGHTSHCCVYCYGISYFKKLPVISTAYKRAREKGVLVCILMSGWLHVRLIHRSCWSSRGSRLPVKLSITFTWPCRCSCRLQCFRPPVKKNPTTLVSRHKHIVSRCLQIPPPQPWRRQTGPVQIPEQWYLLYFNC